ncbi:hypothetical protein C1J03_12055 [Sulfitobacter sp. SK012]|uniref:hypothetical protein n=1 Tax=Sulfitobacter sp. SK012 TaxID=1389005 RepID=UPI000E0A37E2|nr:hypothetical protein [Sulfitobacter sp. SK012]AXI46691.1 hypothetical protein C1J03_12055 [Sulfitobacter sp. SK012]
MQFLTTTPLALLLFGAILLLGPVRGLWCFFLSMPLGSAAALGLTGLGTLSMPDFCIVALWVSLLFHRVGLANLAGTLKPGQPGFLLLLVLVISAIGAIFMPRVMTGWTDVFVVASQAGSDTLVL